ncbi:hypothetical protein ACHAQJ_004497 [Trichoderma viride]
MAAIQNVAVAGASGNFGPHVLKALLQANLNVTVLTRSHKAGAFDENVKVVEVDFTSVKSLTSALQSQDAIISTIGPAGLESQKLLIDAAVAAGVQRFIPSDFGVCTTSPKVSNLPFYSTLASIRQYLMDKAATSTLSYTILAPGSFLEYFLLAPMVVDFKNHTVAFIDGGNVRVSATTLASAGKAVCSILTNLDKTKNRVVYATEAILTQQRILDIAKEIKPEIEWTTSNIKSADILKEGLDAFASGNYSAVGKVLIGTVFGGEEYGAAYDKNDNSILGIEPITQEKLRDAIAKSLS